MSIFLKEAIDNILMLINENKDWWKSINYIVNLLEHIKMTYL